METLYIGAASTDANIPISLGIPAITVAGEEKAVESIPSTNGTNLQNPGKDHSVTLLLLLALSGYENIREYQLPRINPKGK